MRIVVANSFHYRRGGDSGQFLDLVAHLERRGHEVATFCMHHPDNLPSAWSEYWAPYTEYRGALTPSQKLRALGRSTYSAENGRRMALLLADFRPDIVHFHSVHHHLTLAVVQSCLRLGVPVVWTLHDYRSVCPATSLLRGDQVCERCAGGHFWHCLVGRCKSGEFTRSLAAVGESYLTRVQGVLGAIDCYVAPSRFLADKVVQMGLPAKRIEALPNPVRLDPAQRTRVNRRALLYVGRLSTEKGVDCLIRAVEGLRDVSLRIVGDGPEFKYLRDLSARLGVDATFDGWAEVALVRARMAEAGLMCVPSVGYENCPGVALEALAAGLPVVVSNLGGLVELVDGGRAGWLASAGDPREWRRVIMEALEDETRTAQQAANALARVRTRHDPELFIEHLETVYQSLLA